MTRLRHRLHVLFRPARPRAPWMRVLLAVAGLALMLLMVVVALVLGAAWLLGRLLWRVMRPTPAHAPDEGVIDGEFRVVPRREPALRSQNA